MRKFITTLNLVASVGMTYLMTFSMTRSLFSLTIQNALQLAACLLWVFCALWLRRSRRLWPWIGCLILVSAMSLIWGTMLLRVVSLIWQAGYGDRSIEIDPSTVGAPFFVCGFLTLCTSALLITLFSLPAWQFKKEKDS